MIKTHALAIIGNAVMEKHGLRLISEPDHNSGFFFRSGGENTLGWVDVPLERGTFFTYPPHTDPNAMYISRNYYGKFDFNKYGGMYRAEIKALHPKEQEILTEIVMWNTSYELIGAQDWVKGIENGQKKRDKGDEVDIFAKKFIDAYSKYLPDCTKPDDSLIF